MLAHSGVEALHGRCMPNHGRGRIRAAALHACCIIKTMRLTDQCPMLTTHDNPFDRGSAEEQKLMEEAKEMRG